MTMATRIGIGGASALPLDLALSIIPSLPRPLLARFVARAIDHLDLADGDPDLEEDDPQGEDSEGEPNFARRTKAERRRDARRYGPGCALGDPDAVDEREPEAYDGGYSDNGFAQHRGGDLTPYSWHPHPDMRRIEAKLRSLRS